MKPPPFEYYRATTLEDAIALLRRYGPDAKVLAGGQSLLPMMKVRRSILATHPSGIFERATTVVSTWRGG
jgi:CO/xanthine dehydrogenase FAD-binding subunit